MTKSAWKMTAAIVNNEPLEVSLSGYRLLDDPLLNKSSALPDAERRELGLMGLLPLHTSTIEKQLARVYENYLRKDSAALHPRLYAPARIAG